MTTVEREASPYAGVIPSEQGLYIGGQDRPSANNKQFVVDDPATGATVAYVADGTVEDAVAAVDAAHGAFAGWSQTPARARSEVLRRTYELMIAESDELATIVSAENGKPLADSRGEIIYAAEFFRWFAEEAVRSEGGYGPAPTGGTKTIVSTQPVGVAALVTPWNFPAAMATRKIAPALAAGCTAVLKPASATPLTALAIARIVGRAGAPDGVVNVLPSSRSGEVVSTWLSDDRVRKLSFTGSTGVGRRLLTQAAQNVVNSSMELGGNAPFVVGPDADIQAAVQGAMQAKFRNGGQVCTAANRFYVHADVLADFTREFGAAITALEVGNGFHDGTTIGPLISRGAVTEVGGLVDAAVSAGARIGARAECPEGPNYYPPTMLLDVPQGAEILGTEIFGPVAPVVTWSDDDELARLVNDTEYGLASYIYSRDLKWALQFAERIESGIVGVNRGLVSDPAAPFGGVKQSGIGREGGREGIREFQEIRYYSVDWS